MASQYSPWDAQTGIINGRNGHFVTEVECGNRMTRTMGSACSTTARRPITSQSLRRRRDRVRAQAGYPSPRQSFIRFST